MADFFTNEEETKGYAYWSTEDWEAAFDNGSLVDWSEKAESYGFVATRTTVFREAEGGYEAGVYIELWKSGVEPEPEFEYPRRAA